VKTSNLTENRTLEDTVEHVTANVLVQKHGSTYPTLAWRPTGRQKLLLEQFMGLAPDVERHFLYTANREMRSTRINWALLFLLERKVKIASSDPYPLPLHWPLPDRVATTANWPSVLPPCTVGLSQFAAQCTESLGTSE
jgi:hypothetical protein